MNKFFLYIFLLTATLSYPQPSQGDIAIEVAEDSYQDVAGDTVYVSEPPVYSQRNFKDGFKDSYTDDEFQYEPKTRAKSAWDRFWEAVGAFLRRLFGAGEDGANSGIMSFLGYFLAGAVVLFAIYMIVRTILDKESGWIFGKSHKKINVLEFGEEDITQMDFPTLIDESRKNADYRLTVRYYYLWLLKRMAQRNIIDWHFDKTNTDYVYEIKDSALKKDFQYLSYVYDYSWYGDFPLDEAAFNKAESAFRKTLNTI